MKGYGSLGYCSAFGGIGSVNFIVGYGDGGYCSAHLVMAFISVGAHIPRFMCSSRADWRGMWLNRFFSFSRLFSLDIIIRVTFMSDYINVWLKKTKRYFGRQAKKKH